MADLDENHNKWWTGKLYSDNCVETFWGRVGDSGQSKKFPGQGERFLLKKQAEKEKKGYRPLLTVQADSVSPATVNDIASNQLETLALSQIKMARPELKSLVSRLVKSNIHKISSVTNGAVTFNSATGLFQTPLGIVTPAGITEARNLLSQVKTERDNNNLTARTVNQYLCLVPQNFGRNRTGPYEIFPDVESVQKQLDVLDSLESSYQAIQKVPVSATTQTEQIFSLDLDMLEKGEGEYDRLNQWYETSKRSMHGYGSVRIVNVYKVEIKGSKFESLGVNQEVFHGTSEANLLSILKSGLRSVPPSTAHIAGALFGPGVYGAIHSTKSLNYSTGFWGGSRGASAWLFVCDFAMGKVYETKSYGTTRPSGFDSIWAKSSSGGLNHDELIVPRESQVKIKYLLECK